MAVSVVEVSPNDSARMDEIGLLRLAVWREETAVEETLFPDGRWIEPLDAAARHWIALDDHVVVGAARLTLHSSLEDNPDGYLWLRAGREVPVPAAHLCKLVVLRSARGAGIGRRLNQLRIDAARAMGAKSILVTASETNSRLLLDMGFTDTGVRETFANRPGYSFRALQRVL